MSHRKYEQKTLILGYFGQFWTIFGQKRGNFEFSTKKRNGQFFIFIKPRLHEKNQKNLMRQFENMSKQVRLAMVPRLTLQMF